MLVLRLYWTDSGKSTVESVNPDGSNRLTFAATFPGQPMGITIFQVILEFLYLSMQAFLLVITHVYINIALMQQCAVHRILYCGRTPPGRPWCGIWRPTLWVDRVKVPSHSTPWRPTLSWSMVASRSLLTLLQVNLMEQLNGLIELSCLQRLYEL